MRKYLFSLVFVCLSFSCFSQIETLIRLHQISIGLGLINDITSDTNLVKSNNQKIKKREEQKQLYLLRSAEYYKSKDFESSIFYIKKVKDFEHIDLNNLKYVIKVGSYANTKDLYNTIRNYVIAKRIVDPVNLRLIKNEIKNNFTKEEFIKGYNKIMIDSGDTIAKSIGF